MNRVVTVPLRNALVTDQPVQKGDVGGNAPHPEFPQCALHAVDGGRPDRPPGRHLFQQGIVMAGDDRPGIGRAAVQADAESGRGPVGREATVVRNEPVQRVFGGDAALQRMAAQHDVFLGRAGRVRVGADGRPFGDADLRLDQVDARHLLGHRVFHLDARIDLDEVELPGVQVLQELDRAGVDVAGVPGDA